MHQERAYGEVSVKIVVKNNNIKINRDALIYNDGVKVSYNKGKHHKVDGPTIEYNNGDETWWFENMLHKKYGPACKWRSGDRWRLNDEHYTQEEFMEKFL